MEILSGWGTARGTRGRGSWGSGGGATYALPWLRPRKGTPLTFVPVRSLVGGAVFHLYLQLSLEAPLADKTLI